MQAWPGAAYVIQTSGSNSINFASGFPNATGLQLNGVAAVSNNALEITNGGAIEANSAFWTTPVNIQAFTTNFTFQLTSAQADGFTFTIQNVSPTALGGTGGGLGYGADPGGVSLRPLSPTVSQSNSTSLTTAVRAMTRPEFILMAPFRRSLRSTSLLRRIVLASGDTIAAQLVYNGTTLDLQP